MRPEHARIAAKLAAVRDQKLTCFGCQSHDFRLGPPATEAALAAFEATHGIRLPEDYRDFLRTLGEGGAGPYYGLSPLSRWDDGNDGDPSPECLASPCPLVPGTRYGDDWAEQAFHTLADDDERHARRLQGTLTLGTQGCTLFMFLVVTGPARGRVFYLDIDGGAPYFVEHADFITWYERWLDELLAGCTGTWFGIGMPGLEPELRAALASGERRADALAAMCRLPRLSPAGLAEVATCLSDPVPEVRAAAHRTWGNLARDRPEALHPGLSDRSPQVQRAALWALRGTADVSWHDHARALLVAPDREVAEAACGALDKHLTIDDLRAVLSGPHASEHGLALYRLAELDDPRAAATAAAYLGDPRPELLRNALLVLSRQRAPEASPTLRRLANHDDGLVAVLACRALHHHAPADGVDAWIGLTRREDAGLRQNAARALGELGDPRALPVLRALLADDALPSELSGGAPVRSGERVCDAARTALTRLEATLAARA